MGNLWFWEKKPNIRLIIWDDKFFVLDFEGTVRTAISHIITGVIGSGVLSLSWSVAQLGWIGGPLALLVFAVTILFSSCLLCNCYRTPDPEYGPHRNCSYNDAVYMTLGEAIQLLLAQFVDLLWLLLFLLISLCQKFWWVNVLFANSFKILMNLFKKKTWNLSLV